MADTHRHGDAAADAMRYRRRCATAGHVPLRIEGASVLGQYIRKVTLNALEGAGNQFASFATPGESC
jgi:hypothetical protein